MHIDPFVWWFVGILLIFIAYVASTTQSKVRRPAIVILVVCIILVLINVTSYVIRIVATRF